jgi:isohexenylglutaconyl-CoA hydratase
VPYLCARIGAAQTRRLALTAMEVDAHEARRIGLVHEVQSESDSVDAAVAYTLERIRSSGPRAIATTKRLIRDCAPIADHVVRAAGEFASALASAEGREGVAAFRERRKPVWPT